MSVILISGASSGFGALSARALAVAGHTVYAGIRGTTGKNIGAVHDAEEFVRDRGADLRTVELDVVSDDSVREAVELVVRDAGRIDVLVHNAGHMSTGAAEAFSPEQFAELYDVNVLSTQRLNRAVLPDMRRRGEGLLVWVSSTSVKGGTPPYLAPYFAAKAAMDSLAVSYAGELARWGVETSIVVPGAFPIGTSHFAHAGAPDDSVIAAEYETRYAGVGQQVGAALAGLFPSDASADLVADEITRIVGLPRGQRPFRVHVDPLGDGSQEVSDVADRVRREFLVRAGLGDLLELPGISMTRRKETP